MSNTRDIDDRLRELLGREAPVPEHGEGYRERLFTLLVEEGAARTRRKRRWQGRAWPAPKAVKETPVVVRRVARRPTRYARPAIVVTLVCLLLLIALAGTLEPLQRLVSPTMILRITDATIVDPADPAATRTTVVATSLASLDETRELIHDLIETINANDTTAVRKFYATNGWLDESASETSIQGSVGIAGFWRDAHDRLGLQVEADGDLLSYDRYVAQPVRYRLPNGQDVLAGVFVFQIDTSGRIAHQWITGWAEE